MPVTPIGNYQAMLPNSSEVGGMQSRADQQTLATQTFVNAELQDDTYERQLQVQTKEDVEDGKVNVREEKKNYSRQQQRKRHEVQVRLEEDREEEIRDAIRGHNIDIKF